MRTGAFDLLLLLQGRLLVVYWLTGQGKDPDLCHLAQHVLLVAAEREDLASLCRVLHHLGGKGERGSQFGETASSELASQLFRSSVSRRCPVQETDFHDATVANESFISRKPLYWFSKYAEIPSAPPAVNSIYPSIRPSIIETAYPLWVAEGQEPIKPECIAGSD